MQSFKRCRRIFFIMMITLFIFNIYLLRLAQIQLLRSRPFTVMAVEQRAEKLVLDSCRGNVYDRHGNSLLDSFAQSAIVAFPALIRGSEEQIIAAYPWILGIEKIRDRKNGPERPMVIATNVREDELQKRGLPPGMALTEIKVRYGPDSLAPHVVGHLNRSGVKGAAGLERYYNKELSPTRATSLVALVDGRRRLIGGLGYKYWHDTSITSPYNIHLTLDRNTQGIVERVMEKHIIKGAVVVMDPWTGDLLAVASLPDFDQNNIEALFLETEESIRLREGEPFLNRAIGSYFPASTFKTVVAAAYLESGLDFREFTYSCPGPIDVGCVRDHGQVDLAEALAQSCNGAFIHMGLELGSDTLLEYARAFGFGEKTGIPLDGEGQGHLPGEGMDSGILALASIGQGDVGVTPLQLARAYSAIANGGYLPAPRLVDSISTRTGLTIKRYPALRSDRIISPGTVGILKEMLHKATDTGTGRQAASPMYEAAVKTGTAETGKSIDGKEVLNYWIAGFAPKDNPRYTVVVFMEESRGNATAARIFREIMEQIY